MRKTILSAIILCLLSFASFAQTDSPKKAPYLVNPTIPPFKLRMMDSSIYNAADIPKGKPIVFIFFNPECEHCKQLTDSLTSYMDKGEFKDSRIYMCGVSDLYKIREFGVARKLDRFSNITLTKDQDMFFLGFYNATSFPWTAAYDRHKHIIQVFDGSITIPQLIKTIKQKG